jgi:hypothetical protein
LTYNTPDKSRREWTKLFNSIENLITNNNIYLSLIEKDADSLMEGFRVSQRNEEIFKAHIIVNNRQAKDILFEIENNDLLRGNISGLLRATCTDENNKIEGIKLSDCDPKDFQNDQIKKITELFDCYNKLSKNDFGKIRGDFIITPLYEQSSWRLTWNTNYKKHDATFQMTFDYYKKRIEAPDMSVDDFAIYKEKEFLKKLDSGKTLSADNRKIREQLYMYYILTVRIMELGIGEFFKNGYNFGWLEKQKSFSSIFNGIDDSINEFQNKNPIYQTYRSQFRYSYGLQLGNALPPEIVGGSRMYSPFDRLLRWSNESLVF